MNSQPLSHAEAKSDTPATETTPATESASIFSLPLTELRMGDPIRWLQLGWADFVRCPRIGLFYGLCFFAMGHALMAVFQSAPEYVLALSAGFLLMGPFLCLGLYDASKAMQTQSHRPSLRASLQAWRPTRGTMAIFAGVLLILEMLWGRAALVVFAVSFTTMPDKANLLAMLLDPENIAFLITYTAVGGFFAGLIFVTSVISIPMIMDRRVDAVSAGLTSIRACLQNPGVMLWWGALITSLVLLAILPVFLGLFIVGPVLGHATWHAYRHIVPAPQA
ncbi:COG5473 Predicted integral membrane protein [Burkholderiaceae bacterium]